MSFSWVKNNGRVRKGFTCKDHGTLPLAPWAESVWNGGVWHGAIYWSAHSFAPGEDEHSFDGAAMASGYITPDQRTPLRSLARFRGHGKEANVYFRIPLPKSGLVRGQKKKKGNIGRINPQIEWRWIFKPKWEKKQLKRKKEKKRKRSLRRQGARRKNRNLISDLRTNNIFKFYLNR